MGEVQLISTTTVRAAAAAGCHKPVADRRRIELTPWDLRLVLVGPIQKGLLFLKPNSNCSAAVDHLKSSFKHTLGFFPPLAGRLSAVKNGDAEDTTSFFIDCNNAGAEFIHAVADGLAIADILEPKFVPLVVQSFFPMNGVPNHQGTSEPVFAVQVTEVVDGFFIGCTMNHVVGDGSSFWNFFNCWSEVSRGSNEISRPPVLERWFPDDAHIPIRLRLRAKQLNHQMPPSSSLEERIFHFTKAKITELKTKANNEMGTTNISSFQSLVAHLWRAVIRCQNLPPKQETKCFFMVGVRPRLTPSLPENYYGNATEIDVVSVESSTLLKKGLGWVAWQINKMIASKTNDELRKSFKLMAANLEPFTMKIGTNNVLSISSSPRFNVYGNDFGWGPPLAVRCGMANKYSWKITIFSGKKEGSIDFHACLSPEILLAMENDAEFMEAIT